MTISQLEEAGIRKVATKVTTTLNCLEGAVQGNLRVHVEVARGAVAVSGKRPNANLTFFLTFFYRFRFFYVCQSFELQDYFCKTSFYRD